MTGLATLAIAETGQDLVEYALLAGLIALAALAAIQNLGTGLNNVWTGVTGSVTTLPTP